MRLLLLRHAKSERGKDEPDDHDRPLAARGRKASPEMAIFMRTRRYVPELVLCSTARRTKETLDLLLPAWKKRPKVRYERGLYLADWPRLLEVIRGVSANVSPLLVVGHNPGLEQLAIALALQPQSLMERSRLQLLSQKFPTAALAVLDFSEGSWRGIKPGQGRLVDFVRPKDLTAQGEGDEE